MHVNDTDDCTDRGEMWHARRKEDESFVERHTDYQMTGENGVYELLKITNRKMTTVRTNT